MSERASVSEPSGRQSRPTLCALIGWPVAALAALVMVGWMLRVPWMVQIIPGTVAMVFSNAVCLLLLGVALILTTVEHRWSKLAQTLIGVVVLAVGATVMAQYRFDLALPLDLRDLHAWLNNNPGRMAPNTALAHALGGVTVLLTAVARPGVRALLALTAAVTVVLLGITGLVGYRLRPELLYGWHVETRMALHAGVAFVVLGAGFISALYREQQLDALFRQREDLRVGLIGGILMVFVGLVGGMAAFSLMQDQMVSVLQNGLRLSFQSRHDLIVSEISSAIEATQTFAQRPGAQRELARLRSDPNNPAALEYVAAAVNSIVDADLVGARLFDGRGKILISVGSMPAAHAELPLGQGGNELLVWNGHSAHLRVIADIVVRGQRLGRIETADALPGITRMREVALGFGASSDMVLCVPSGDAMRCLPTVLYPERTEIPRATRAGPVLMAQVLAGEKGAGLATDYRGQRVIAAYGPVGELGLGLVLKVDVDEVYAPIRRQFELIMLIILVIVGVGILLLRARLVPLVRRLARSEQRWQFALEGARDGVWDWNLVTNEVFFSRQWKAMLGYEEQEIAHDLQEWDKRVHPDDKAGAYADINKHLSGEVSHYQNEHRLRCKDGTYKWILDRGMIVARDASGKPTRMIGTHTDITARKQAEETIRELSLVDDLTGLRNRRGLYVLGEPQLHLARRLGRMAAVYFADVDGLKRINDELGHAEGDRALVAVADILRATFRETDIVTRLGGDEFVVLALESPDADVAASVARLEQHISEGYRSLWRPVGRLGVSIGVAQSAPDSSESLDELLNRADADMYRVKQQRRAAS